MMKSESNKNKKESIFDRLKKDKVQFICFAIVLFMQYLIKAAPGFLNLGLIIILITYIYSITEAIYSQKEEEYYDRITKFIVFILINSPLIVYTLVLFFKTFPNVLIKVGDANTWIGFAGTIISGTLVMFALVFTLHNEKKVKDHEFKLKNIPVISLELSEEYNYEYKLKDSMKFIIKNIGNNHIRNLKIENIDAAILYESFEDNFNKDEIGKLDFNHYIDINEIVSLLPINKTHEICFNLYDSNEYFKSIESKFVKIETNISYWNVLANSEYKYKSTYLFLIFRDTIDSKVIRTRLKFYSSSSFYDPDTYSIKELN